MSEKKYTAERNVQIVISLLKQHGIHRVIASPGTTNMTFVGSIQNDPWFQIWSSVDERSAAYLACGMAEESGEPVVLSCTGATASRNYMPGLTEAYYRKLPVLAITSHRGEHAIGHLIDQQLDRRERPRDIAIESVTIPLVKDATDEDFCIIEANKAILALRQKNGGGPVHINMYTAYSPDFSVEEISPVRKIERYTLHDELPSIPKAKHIGITIGSHALFTKEEEDAIDRFCATYDAVVFCDHTSAYSGKYKVNFSLVCGQEKWHTDLCEVDLLIHIGEISGDNYKPWAVGEQWRISVDGELRNRFKNLTKVFMMPEINFFNHYATGNSNCHTYIDECKKAYDLVYRNIPELPFGNIWMAKELSSRLPQNCSLHLGIYNSLRSWNFFNLPSGVKSNCNVGGFGIDGGVSSLIGASLCHPDRLYYGVFGDLAFFYDMNVVGNRHVGNNVRILLINNGRGTEFRNYAHPCSIFGEEADPYMAAAGHYGNQSANLVKHYSQDLGYLYLSAVDKDSFMLNVETFINPAITEQPILFEVFTDTDEESAALETMLTFMVDEDMQRRLKRKELITHIIGEKSVQMISNFINR